MEQVYYLLPKKRPVSPTENDDNRRVLRTVLSVEQTQSVRFGITVSRGRSRVQGSRPGRRIRADRVGEKRHRSPIVMRRIVGIRRSFVKMFFSFF